MLKDVTWDCRLDLSDSRKGLVWAVLKTAMSFRVLKRVENLLIS
jgi:hypothetical protein